MIKKNGRVKDSLSFIEYATKIWTFEDSPRVARPNREKSGIDINKHFQGDSIAFENIADTQEYELLYNKISQEIEQLPIALAKAGFSQEEIKEALKNYTSLIKEFDEEVIESIKDKDNNELKEWLKEYEEGTYGLGSYETGLSDGLGDVIKKMQELEGSDSNE